MNHLCRCKKTHLRLLHLLGDKEAPTNRQSDKKGKDREIKAPGLFFIFAFGLFFFMGIKYNEVNKMSEW